MNTAILETLAPEQVERLIAALNRVADAMEWKAKTWLTPDEACEVLGFQIAQSGSHRRRLQFLREHGKITRFRPGKPVMYDREEIERIADKIRKGDIYIPANF